MVILEPHNECFLLEEIQEVSFFRFWWHENSTNWKKLEIESKDHNKKLAYCGYEETMVLHWLTKTELKTNDYRKKRKGRMDPTNKRDINKRKVTSNGPESWSKNWLNEIIINDESSHQTNKLHGTIFSYFYILEIQTMFQSFRVILDKNKIPH